MGTAQREKGRREVRRGESGIGVSQEIEITSPFLPRLAVFFEKSEDKIACFRLSF
jgi:hypothetical protein